MDKRAPGTHPQTRTSVHTAFGIDLTSTPPVIVRAERKGRSLRYDPASSDDLLTSGTERGNVVTVAGLGPTACMTRWITTPLENRSKAMRVFPALLDIQLPFPLEQCRFEFVRISPDVVGGTRALSILARDSNIDELLTSLKDEAFSPMVLDVNALALWSEAIESFPDPLSQEPVAIAHATDQGLTLVLGYRGEYHSAYSLPGMEASALRRVIDALGQNDTDIQWVTSGSATAASQLRGVLTRDLQVDENRIHEPADGHLFLARALARRAIRPDEDNVNLRSGPFVHRDVRAIDDRSEKRTLSSLLAAAIILCLANLSWMVGTAWLQNETQKQFYSRAEAIAGQPMGSARGEDALRKTRLIVAEKDSLSTHLEHALSPGLADPLSSILEAARETGMKLHDLQLADRALQIRGSSADWDQIEIYNRAVRKAGYNTTFERPENTVGDRVPFTISTGGTK